MKMKIETRKTADLKPYERNPRVNDKAVDAVAASIRQFGFKQPIVVDRSGVIIAGHTRWKAAQKLGLKEVPVLVATDLTPAQVKAYRIADNKVGEAAEWDLGLLTLELKDLKGVEFGLEDLGFDPEELADLLPPEDPDTDPDHIPAGLEATVTRPGDLWELGGHRLLCADATEAGSWARLVPAGSHAAMIFTDPPYGISYQGGPSKQQKVMAGDDLREGDLVRRLLKPALQHAAGAAREDAAFYIWHASSTREDFAWAMKAAGLVERQYLIWVKAGIVLGHADYQWAHEPCFYAAKDGQSPAFHGDRSQPTVWRVASAPRSKDGVQAMTVGQGLVLADGEGARLNLAAKLPKQKKIRTHRLEAGQAVLISEPGSTSSVWEVAREASPDHPTQKPVALARIAIENSSRRGDVVCDPFLGSGCTLMACEVTGRSCMGMELEPRYADLIVRRWMAFTQQSPRLIRDGKEVAWPQIAATWASTATGATAGDAGGASSASPAPKIRKRSAPPAAVKLPKGKGKANG